MASGNVRRRLAVGLAVVLVTVVAVMAAAGAWLLFGPVPQREPVAEGEPVADVVTRSILVLGVDGDGRALEGQRSDSILLARVGESTVDLVSFPRDLLVDVPACTGSAGESKLNSVYAAASDADGVDAGVRCLAGTLRDISGIRVDDYVVLNMSSVVELVDVLGGVTVCLDESEAAAGAVPGVVEVGCHRLNGTQAMAYARARKGVADGSDLSRIKRQHTVLGAVAKEMGSLDPVRDLPTFLQLGSTLRELTESSLSLTNGREIRDLVRRFGEADLSATRTVPVIPAGDGANVRLAPEADEFFRDYRRGAPLTRG